MSAVKTAHSTITRIRDGRNFTEPGGPKRVFHPPTSVAYLPPIPIPSKILAGGNTKFLTFTMEESISYLSERMTLESGDVVSLGAPSPSMPFAADETIEISTGNLGSLRNGVVSEPAHRMEPIQPRR